MSHFVDRFLALSRQKGAPVCVGIDPVFDKLPAELRKADDPLGAIETFCGGVLEAAAPFTPIVKFQSACFERYLSPGLACLHRLITRARELGLLSILDAKRGDIGSSADHYAAGCLDDPGQASYHGPDALTVNAYFGLDGLEPFLKTAARRGRGLFALVRTSNPGGDAIQSLSLTDGRTVAEAMADLVARLGSEAAYVGERGYSLLGAVVGATKPADAHRLRERMPGQLFLVPGFGAQGGGAEDVKACFKPDGTGAMITASRSVTYPSAKPGTPWHRAIADAAQDLRNQIADILR